MTFPSIFCLIFTMMTAFLSYYIPKKMLAVTGLIIVCAAGIFACMFHGTLNILFFWAAVLGIGIGIGSMLMTFLGGLFAAVGWNFGYLVYLLGIPGILFSLAGLPGKRQLTSITKSSEPREPFRLVIWKEMLITLLLLMAFSATPANLSMLVAEKTNGGTAPMSFS